MPRRGMRGIHEVDIEEEWSACALQGMPETPVGMEVPSIFFARPGIYLDEPVLQARLFAIRRGLGWKEVILWALNAAGWRLECAVAEVIYPERVPHPLFKRFALIVVGAINDCDWIGLREQQSSKGQGIRQEAVLTVGADILRFEDLHVLASDMRGPGARRTRPASFSVNIMGQAPQRCPEMLPKCAPLGQRGRVSNSINRTVVSAGDGASCNRVRDRLVRRGWRLQSTAAPQVAVICGELAPLLRSPLASFSCLRE